jgi:hypothetical protein
VGVPWLRPQRRTTMTVKLIALALLTVCAYALLLLAAHSAHPCYVTQWGAQVYIDGDGTGQRCYERKWWLP